MQPRADGYDFVVWSVPDRRIRLVIACRRYPRSGLRRLSARGDHTRCLRSRRNPVKPKRLTGICRALFPRSEHAPVPGCDPEPEAQISVAVLLLARAAAE